MSSNSAFQSWRCPVTQAMSPNQTKNYEGFHLSHNRRTSDYGCETTSIVLKDRVFFVLNGDHRDALCNAADTGGVQACMDYFMEHIAEANKLSEHHIIIGKMDDYFGLINSSREIIGQATLNRIIEAASAIAA